MMDWMKETHRLIRINNRKKQGAEHNPALTISARCGPPHEMTELTLKPASANGPFGES
jgi:hypothetical protein